MSRLLCGAFLSFLSYLLCFIFQCEIQKQHGHRQLFYMKYTMSASFSFSMSTYHSKTRILVLCGMVYRHKMSLEIGHQYLVSFNSVIYQYTLCFWNSGFTFLIRREFSYTHLKQAKLHKFLFENKGFEIYVRKLITDIWLFKLQKCKL